MNKPLCKTFVESCLATLDISISLFLKPIPEVRVKVTKKYDFIEFCR